MILKCAVYKISSIISGTIYIGSTADVDERKGCHFRSLRRGVHKNKHLQSAFDLYGESNFIFEVIEHIDIQCNNRKEARPHIELREQHYLDTLLFASSNDNRFHELGYNNRRKASSNLGMKYSEEYCKSRMGKNTGIKRSPEQIAAMILRNTGKKRSEESKKRYSIAVKKRRSDPEQEAKRKKKITSQEEKDRNSLRYGKPVLQFDLQGNFIAEYHASAVAVKETGIKSVRQCCLGLYTKAERFVFIYKQDFEKLSKEDFDNKLLIANSTYAGGFGATPVQQLDKETLQIINTFKSTNEAARVLGKMMSGAGGNIASACKGKLKTSYGFKWQYA